MTKLLYTVKSEFSIIKYQQFVKKLLVTILVLVCAFYVSNNWFQLTMVQGNSMFPLYRNLQIVILDRHNRDYTYGDVVAFRCDTLSTVLIKRIAACPGDTVVIENKTLLVNGQSSTVYPEEMKFHYSGLLEQPVKLKSGQYIVIGDNISQSKDSRHGEVGKVSIEKIVGKVIQQ